jgi:hypothetical protein
MLMCGFTAVLDLDERGLATLLRSANSKKNPRQKWRVFIERRLGQGCLEPGLVRFRHEQKEKNRDGGLFALWKLLKDRRWRDLGDINLVLGLNLLGVVR